MDLLKLPGLMVLYFTLITPSFPGSIGSLGHSGTVQPHEARTLLKINGFLPLLVNLNSQLPSPP